MQIKFRSGIVPAPPIPDVKQSTDPRVQSSGKTQAPPEKKSVHFANTGASSRRTIDYNTVKTPKLYPSTKSTSVPKTPSNEQRRRDYGDRMDRHSKFRAPVLDRAGLAKLERSSHIKSTKHKKSEHRRSKNDDDSGSSTDGGAKKSGSHKSKSSVHEKPGRFEAEAADVEKRRKHPDLQEIVMNGKRLRLRRFEPKIMQKIAKNPALVMVAKRGSGKSVALRHIQKDYSDIPGGIIMSRTERVNPFFKHYFPDAFIYDDYTPEAVRQLLERQERIKEKSARRVQEGKRPLDTRAIIVMDDCLSSAGSWKKDEGLAEIMMNGRHYDLMYILTMQYPLGIGPDLRINFDFVFLFGENYANIRRKIYEHYCGVFPSFASFEKVFAKCTTHFGCIVLNNREKSSNIEDVVYWWRAKDQNIDGYVGSKNFKKYHDMWYNADYRKANKLKSQHFDLGNLMGKSQKNRLPDFDIDLEGVDDDGSGGTPKKKR